MIAGMDFYPRFHAFFVSNITMKGVYEYGNS